MGKSYEVVLDYEVVAAVAVAVCTPSYLFYTEYGQRKLVRDPIDFAQWVVGPFQLQSHPMDFAQRVGLFQLLRRYW